MGAISICLSSASILRCHSLTRIQNICLIIPTALEIIFSTSLVFIQRGPGKRNVLLTVEGLSFLTLAVLELLSNTLPAVRENLHLFEAVDLAIGIASLLPISFYTIFLYLLIVAEALRSLPRRIKNTTILAPLFIVAIVISNGATVFTSFSIQQASTSETITVGSPSPTNQKAWRNSTYLALALLTCFQATVLSFALFRLSQIIRHRRRITCQCSDKSHPIKGIGWISGSLLLGATETIIGFAVGGFAIVLTRRILRLVTRAILCVGVAKGIPSRTMYRPSQLRGIISNPRISTFQHIPTKVTPQSPQASPVIQEKSAPCIATTVGLPDKVHLEKARVSIRYHRGRPSLHLRLSTFDMPSPATFVDQIKARRESSKVKLRSGPDLSPPRGFHRLSHSVFRGSVDSTLSSYAPVELVTAPRRTLSQRSARAKLYQAKALPTTSKERLCSESTVVDPQDLSRGQSTKSGQSTTKSIPDSLQAVQELADQFPGPPTTFGDEDIHPAIAQALGSPSQLRSEWVTSIHSSDTLSDNSSNRRTLYNVTRSSSLYQVKPCDPFQDDQLDAPSPSRTDFSDIRMPPEAGSGEFKLATVTALNIVKSRPYKPREPRVSSITKKDFFAGNPRNSTALNVPKRGNPKHIVIPPRPLDTPEILDECDVGWRFLTRK